jgi:hypothetical protein
MRLRVLAVAFGAPLAVRTNCAASAPNGLQARDRSRGGERGDARPGRPCAPCRKRSPLLDFTDENY